MPAIAARYQGGWEDSITKNHAHSLLQLRQALLSRLDTLALTPQYILLKVPKTFHKPMFPGDSTMQLGNLSLRPHVNALWLFLPSCFLLSLLPAHFSWDASSSGQGPPLYSSPCRCTPGTPKIWAGRGALCISVALCVRTLLAEFLFTVKRMCCVLQVTVRCL